MLQDEGELIRGLLLPTPPRTWPRRAGGQLKTWATTVKADLEPRVFGHARWRKVWMKVSCELAVQDRRAWSASVRDVVNAIGDAGSTYACDRTGWNKFWAECGELQGMGTAIVRPIAP